MGLILVSNVDVVVKPIRIVQLVSFVHQDSSLKMMVNVNVVLFMSILHILDLVYVIPVVLDPKYLSTKQDANFVSQEHSLMDILHAKIVLLVRLVLA